LCHSLQGSVHWSEKNKLYKSASNETYGIEHKQRAIAAKSRTKIKNAVTKLESCYL